MRDAADVGDSMLGVFDYVWNRFTTRLVRATARTRARPPFTTIAWRIGHLAGQALGDEVVHHAAEVGVVRDLYRLRDRRIENRARGE